MKIRVYINGEYQFTSEAYKTCKELKNNIRSKKHIEIASVPTNKVITINDADSIRTEIAR